MSDSCFFDTNVLLYLTHPTDSRGDIVRSLVLLKQGIISVQVLNEFVNVARRKLQRDWNQIEAALESLLDVFPEPRPLTLDTHTLAVSISKRFGYGFYDGLILAAAIESSCSVLYSEDMQNGQRIGSVLIRNPFVGTYQ